MKPSLLYYIVFIFLSKGSVFSQVGIQSKAVSGSTVSPNFFVKGGDVFGTRVFIENKGQYHLNKAITTDSILFKLDHGQEKIYFTNRGLIYEFVKEFPLTEKQREEEEEGKSVEHKENEYHYVFMNWVGSGSSSFNIVSSNKQSHYFTYGTEEQNAYTFKKLTFKNVYDKIDIEYIIPDDKEFGIKYTIIVNEGADAKNIKLCYSGDVKKIKQTKAGEIIISSTLNDLVEHLPMSYYSDKTKLASNFKLNHDTIEFSFPQSLQANKAFVIDPWVSPVNTLPANNFAYDVDYDFGGNVFVFGGIGYTKVAMYNLNGILQWTFSGSITSPVSWNSQISSTYGSVGNFVVDKFGSKTYVGQGANNPQIIRLTANGNYDNYITPVNTLYQELWDMGFHCTSGEIYVLGGGHTSNTSAATINTLTPSLILSTFQPLNTSFVHDISTHTIDDFGNIFVYYACSNAPLNNKICRVNSTFNGNVWTQPSGYNVLAEINNKNNYLGGIVNSAGYNGLAANTNYLFYYDGANLAAYAKATGTFVASTNTGLLPKKQGGIVVDDCNTIYVGGDGTILTYHFSGTSFSTLTPIPLSLTITTQRVFDIKLNKNNKTLYVSGSGFVGTYSAGLSYTCPTAPGICIYNQAGVAASTSSITCATLGSATVTPNGGIGPYSFTWIPSGQTGSVGVGLTPGTYTIVVYDAGYNATYSTLTTFLSPVPLTGTLLNSFILNCYGNSNGTATLTNLSGGSGSQTYLWTNGVTSYSTPSISGLSAGNYSLTVTDGLTGCILNPTFTIYQPPALISFIMASTPTACVGEEITFSGITAGGVPGYTYSWNNGITTSTLSVIKNSGGPYTFTLTSTDANTCVINSQISVNYISSPPLSISNVSICPNKTGTLTATGATTYTWSNAQTGNTFTASPLTNTSYSVIGSAMGCTAAASGFILLQATPAPTLSSNSPICNTQSLQINALGAANYIWQGPNSYTSLIQNPLINPANPTNSGVYTATLTSAFGCTASATHSVTVYPSPTLSVLGATVCTSQIMYLNSSSNPGASFSWTGPNNFQSNYQNPSMNTPAINNSGTYTVKATSALGCTNSAMAQVSIISPPSLSLALTSPTLCAQAINGSVNNTTLMSAVAASYSIYTPAGISNTNPNGPLSGFSTLAPFQSGIFTATVIGSNGVCSSSSIINFSVIANPVMTISSATPAICVGQSYPYTLQGATSYTWSNSSAGLNNYSSPSPIATPSITSVYAVMGSSLGCLSLTKTSTLTVYALPTLTISPLNPTICIGKSINLIASGTGSAYKWSPYFAMNTFTGSIVTVHPLSQQNYMVVATVNNCTNTAMVTVSVLPLPIPQIVVTNSNVCVKELIRMIGSGGISYNWEGPNAYLYSEPTFSFIANSVSRAGTYTLLVTDEHGCQNYTTTAIAIQPLPYGSLVAGNLSGCVPYCSDFNFVTSATNPNNIDVTWVIEGTKLAAKKFHRCFTTPGLINVNANFNDTISHCTNSATFVINAHPLPTADFSWSPEKPIESMETVVFSDKSKGEQINTWSWFFKTNEEFHSSVQHPEFLFKDAGKYPIVLIAKNAWGCSDTAIKVITVEPDFTIFIPNAFSPNGDGVNDVFLPVLRGVKSFYMAVFNRWGAKLFETSEPTIGWNGYYNGEACKMDVYIWKATISGLNGAIKELNGHVTISK